MTHLKLYNYNTGNTELTETPLTLREYIAIHWGAWGFYQVTKTGTNQYLISDRFSNMACYTVEKIKNGGMKK